MQKAAREIQIEFPEKLQFLFEPYRYKVAYGGRGGSKSWSFARALIVMSLQRQMLIVCAREHQNSIRDSVHRLLEKQIKDMGLSACFEVTNDRIVCRITNSEFIFKGLWQNVDNIKSLEGADVVWIEEGNLTSKQTWKKLTPTVRKEGSEIWVSYNPELEEDYLHQVFVLGQPPTGSKVVKINYNDNPWFPKVLEQERLDSKANDKPDEYDHIWEGHCKQAIDGAIFADELQLAADEQRLTRVPIKAGIPVQTFWDLGQSDNTAIWFVQIVGLEFRLVDYYQNSGKKMPHYIEVLAERGYHYDEHCLPHDAEHDQLAAKSSIRMQLQEALRDNPKLGNTVRIVPRIPKKATAIEAARDIFGQCIFDSENTDKGLQCLRHYAYARDDETGRVSKQPKHDIFSHGADAFLTFAQHYKKPELAKKPDPYRNRPSKSWMGM